MIVKEGRYTKSEANSVGGRRLLPTIALICALLLTSMSAIGAAETTPIVTGENPDAVVQFAAGELSHFLDGMYPDCDFPVQGKMPEKGDAIAIGTVDSGGPIGELIGDEELDGRDSFLVRAVDRSGRKVGVIAGDSPRGALYGVYELLEELGCGFYMSYNAVPTKAEGSFDFAKWNFMDHPLTPERFVFDWHNFLSSCSTWNVEDWRHWIAQAARMRYSGVMVHAYGNNPMFQFSHNGETKPVGYLATSARGRDWGTQHVNDVRRLYGGQVFDDPVFGSDAAKVAPEKRVEATRKMMQQAFGEAAVRGLDVYFCLDVDTYSANPPEIINTLPESARFESAGRPLANPDTPEGYAYYKSMVSQLMGDYPQITNLVVWHRTGGTLWRRLQVEDFPTPWKQMYRQALEAHPGLKDDPNSPSMFAISRIAYAFERILREIGRDDVQLDTGTWHFGHFRAANAFMPEDMALMGLDWSTIFDTEEGEKAITAVSRERETIPIIWAHHDDRTYIGRSYTPYSNFATRLADYDAAGFGIIHWITRPLDIYFKSHAQQVWKRFKDQPLAITCEQMAARTFGEDVATPMGRYLDAWVRTAPQFGRETSDRFMDRAVSDADEVIAKCKERLAMLDKVDPARMSESARKQYNYYRLKEEFYMQFFRNEADRQQAMQRWAMADLEKTQALLKQCRPSQAIETYAKAATQLNISRGEQALIISMNLRWLPYFVSNGQMVGLAPVRLNYEPTQHEPLAQGAGHHTFFVDSERNYWQGLGEKETGVATYGSVPRGGGNPEPGVEIAQNGLVSDEPIQLKLNAMFNQPLAPGKYYVDLLFSGPAAQGAPKPELIEVALQGEAGKEPMKDLADLSQSGFAGQHCVDFTYKVNVNQGAINLTLTPVRGPAAIAGVVIRPVAIKEPEPIVRERTENELQIEKVTASGAVSLDNAPALSADLDRTTRWAIEGGDHWIQYDLGSEKTVTDISIAWFEGASRKYRFEVLFSNDGKNWEQVYKGESSGNTAGREKIDVPDKKTRYIRIACHGSDQNDWNSINDVLIEGEK